MKEFRLLLFDVDATLVRTGGAGLRAMGQAYAEIMHWPDALQGISMAGRTDTSIAHEISGQRQGRPMTAGELQRVFSRYLALLQDYIPVSENYSVLPGIREFLERVSSRPEFVLGLGTGNLEPGARIKLERGDLNRFFAFGGFGSDAVERAEVLRIAAARGMAFVKKNLSPDAVVVIGDTPHDIAAGRDIGARTIAVATGPYTPEQLSEYKPDLLVPDFSYTPALEKFFGL